MYLYGNREIHVNLGNREIHVQSSLLERESLLEIEKIVDHIQRHKTKKIIDVFIWK